jgi:HpcH/HpaI aldolase/citrate lyase family
MIHQIVRSGNTIITEKLSYKGWQKRYGKSVGRCAPGMFIDHLRRTVAKTGGTLHEVPTRSTKLSQFCHGCGKTVKKPLWQRLHQCACGIGPVQRDLYSAFLAAFLDPTDPIPSCARYVVPWEGAEARLLAAHERKNVRKRGRSCPEAWAFPVLERVCPKVRAKRYKNCFFSPTEGRWKRGSTVQNPPCFSRGSRQFYRDLIEVIEAAGNNIDVVVIPKCYGPEDILFVDRFLTQIEENMGFEIGRIKLEVLIESADAVLHAEQVARCTPRMGGLVFGLVDFAGDNQNILTKVTKERMLTDR